MRGRLRILGRAGVPAALCVLGVTASSYGAATLGGGAGGSPAGETTTAPATADQGTDGRSGRGGSGSKPGTGSTALKLPDLAVRKVSKPPAQARAGQIFT